MPHTQLTVQDKVIGENMFSCTQSPPCMYRICYMLHKCQATTSQEWKKSRDVTNGQCISLPLIIIPTPNNCLHFNQEASRVWHICPCYSTGLWKASFWLCNFENQKMTQPKKWFDGITLQKLPLKPVSLWIAKGISTILEVDHNSLSLKKASLQPWRKQGLKFIDQYNEICLRALPWLGKEPLLCNGKWAFNTGHHEWLPVKAMCALWWLSPRGTGLTVMSCFVHITFY